MAKKRWYAMELNGERFLLDTSQEIYFPDDVSQRSVDDVYGRPSTTKQHIFDSWLHWFVENGGFCGVASFNSMVFTIDGVVRDSATNVWYRCYITPSYNRCVKIK